MKFKYTPVSGLQDTRGKMVKRPVLELELIGREGRKITVPAVIDSGADTSTVNAQYAEFLGLNVSHAPAKQIIGIGEGKIAVRISLFKFTIKQMNMKIEVPAWYVESSNVNILLGQEVFFELFKIKFEKDHDVFEITPSRK